MNCPQVGLRIEGGASTGDGGTVAGNVFHFDPDYAPSVVALPIVDRWLAAHHADELLARDGRRLSAAVCWLRTGAFVPWSITGGGVMAIPSSGNDCDDLVMADRRFAERSG